jgi:hypothetical protein
VAFGNDCEQTQKKYTCKQHSTMRDLSLLPLNILDDLAGQNRRQHTTHCVENELDCKGYELFGVCFGDGFGQFSARSIAIWGGFEVVVEAIELCLGPL